MKSSREQVVREAVTTNQSQVDLNQFGGIPKAHLIEREEYRIHLSKGLLDEIDMVLGRYYDLSKEELAFVVGYDEK